MLSLATVQTVILMDVVSIFETHIFTCWVTIRLMEWSEDDGAPPKLIETDWSLRNQDYCLLFHNQ